MQQTTKRCLLDLIEKINRVCGRNQGPVVGAARRVRAIKGTPNPSEFDLFVITWAVHIYEMYVAQVYTTFSRKTSRRILQA